MFWIVAIALALIATAPFAMALMRGAPDHLDATQSDIDVYQDQLRDVDRDVERGVLDSDEADRLRTEISRRILNADANRQAVSGGPAARPVVLGTVGIVALALVGGSYVLYAGLGSVGGLGAPGYGDLSLADRMAQAETFRQNRPDQATAEAAQPAPPVVAENEEYASLVAQLRRAVAERPEDLEGHVLLAQAEARLNNFAAAHAAQAQVLALKAGAVEPQDLADYSDLLVLAAGGYVSPEAEAVVADLLSRDPQNPVGRYYYGLMLSQTGRPDLAFRLWDGLLREGPADAPWIAPIAATIEDLAARAGVRYQMPVIGNGRGPAQEDIDAAGDLTPAERIEMIRGMVSGLADRLATEGGPPEDWAQLIGSLGVLGRYDDARAIYRNALEVFADDPTALGIVNNAADRAGLI